MSRTRVDPAEPRRLVEELESEGWTRAEIARAIECSRSNVTQLMHGKQSVSEKLLMRLRMIKERKLKPGEVLDLPPRWATELLKVVNMKREDWSVRAPGIRSMVGLEIARGNLRPDAEDAINKEQAIFDAIPVRMVSSGSFYEVCSDPSGPGVLNFIPGGAGRSLEELATQLEELLA